jgi:hypothetical protein
VLCEYVLCEHRGDKDIGWGGGGGKDSGNRQRESRVTGKRQGQQSV